MAERLLLDTNAVIGFVSGDNVITERLQDVEVCVPSIVLGELYYGARRSSRVTDNVAKVDALARQSVVFPCDVGTAQWYGQIKQQAHATGRPIPDNDLWIAAVAVQHGLTLLTRDRHFQNIEDLSVEMW